MTQRHLIDTPLEAGGFDVAVDIDGTHRSTTEVVEAYRAQRIASGDRLDRLRAGRGQVDDQLRHWRGILAELEQAGARVYSPDAIAKGDAVQVGWGWRRVIRVNKRTVTVDDLHKLGQTGTVPYHHIKGHVPGKPTPTA